MTGLLWSGGADVRTSATPVGMVITALSGLGEETFEDAVEPAKRNHIQGMHSQKGKYSVSVSSALRKPEKAKKKTTCDHRDA